MRLLASPQVRIPEVILDRFRLHGGQKEGTELLLVCRRSPGIDESVHGKLCHCQPTPGQSLNSPIRRGTRLGLFFENCLRTMLRKAPTAGLSWLGFNPMSIDVQ